MVLIGCCSFASNKVGNMYIFDSGDIVSALGATVVGILGSIYGHWSPGDALPSMMPGILVLLPVIITFHFDDFENEYSNTHPISRQVFQ